MSLLKAEIIPDVTVPPRPKGFPIAITECPTLALSELANFTYGKGSFDSTFKSAKSVSWSLPTNSAFNSFSSWNLTFISFAWAMTLWFVTIYPLGSGFVL